MEVERCRAVIGAIPIKSTATYNYAGSKNNEFESLLIRECNWEKELVLDWVRILRHRSLLLSLST